MQERNRSDLREAEEGSLTIPVSFNQLAMMPPPQPARAPHINVSGPEPLAATWNQRDELLKAEQAQALAELPHRHFARNSFEQQGRMTHHVVCIQCLVGAPTGDGMAE